MNFQEVSILELAMLIVDHKSVVILAVTDSG